MNEKIRKSAFFLGKIIGITLIIELFLFQFSTITSLFLDQVQFTDMEIEGGEWTPEGDISVISEDGILLHKRQINQKIKNIYLDMEVEGMTVVPYTITLSDEGNAYPYTLPESQLHREVDKSAYVSIYPFGMVKDLTVHLNVPAGTLVRLQGIYGNAVIMPELRIGRMAVIFCLTALFYILKSRNGYLWEPHQTKDAGQWILTGAVAIFLILGAWKMTQVNPVCIQAPWPHHKQYQELARAMAQGVVALDMEVSEGLKEALNPYDTIYLQANGIDYRADYAYYDGQYYVYFGVVPVLLLYLPYFLLTGKDFPNYAAVFLFYSGFIVSLFLLYREMVKRWFAGTPFFLYLLMGILTVSCGNFLFVIARPDLYDTPIMAALMFTAAGLFFWIKGKYEAGMSRKLCLGAGSVCMALVVGCRPQMFLFSLLAVALFWDEVIKERTLFSKKGMADTVILCMPYVLMAAGIMYYNQARFGSVFDFGATYSLTSNDMTNRSYNMQQLLLGIWYFFFQPPHVVPEFPFVLGNQISAPGYMGRLTSEYIYGGVLVSNAFLWIFIFSGKIKNILRQKKIFGFFILSLITAVVIGAVDVTGAGILQRYTVDLIWGIWLGAVFIWLALSERLRGTKQEKYLYTGLYVVCLLQFFYALGVVFGNGDLSVNVRSGNPELFYKLQSMFMIR